MSRRISISCSSPQPGNIGRTLSVAFKVMNDTSERLPAQRLQLIGDDYWLPTCSVALPAISPYTESRPVALKMRCRCTMDPADVPSSFSVRLDESGPKTTFGWSFWVFTKTLRDYSPIGFPGSPGADKYMLLCFGLAGSGKSSFFNSALTLMHEGDDVVNTVASGGTLGHNTTAIKKYDVPSANFTLLDTWGLDRNNYKDEHKVLPALLDGWLLGNWKMDASVRNKRHELAANNFSRNTRRVHGVLFFVIASAVHDDQEMETLKVSFQKVKDMGYEPIVVLSQADRECADCVDDTLGEHKALSELKSKAAAVLGIAQKEIIHSVNYTNSTVRKFETDRLTYKIMDMVLHNAKNFCEADRPLRCMQSLISGDWENEDDVLEW